MECLADDLNVAKAIGLVWQITKSKEINSKTKLELILDFDKVLGLKLNETEISNVKIPEDVKKLVEERDKARAEKDFAKSDKLRGEIESLGFEVKDTPDGTKTQAK